MQLEQDLDALNMTRFHYRLITVAGLGTLFDSMDVGIISFVLAALIGAWHLSNVMVGVVASISLVGMAIGAALAGTVADRLGRRKIFMLTLAIYSIATGLSAAALAVWMLVLFRFIVGIGLGGELPVTSTMVTEFLPRKDRGRGIVLLESFWAIGWLIAALVSYLLIPRYGWRIGFLFGMLPALYILYLRRHIPESPRFLLRTGRVQEAQHVMSLVAGHEVAATMSPPVTARAKGTVLDLFRRGQSSKTIMLWVLWMGMNFAYYGMFLWLPSVLVTHGYSLVDSLKYTLIVTIVQLPGYLSAGLLVDRLGRKPVLVFYILMSAVSAYLFGHAHGVEQVLIFGSMLSFFNLGAWGVTYAYTVEQYPTMNRGTGAGWAMGIGRIGGIIGPTIVGVLLAMKLGLVSIFGVFAAALFIAALTVMILGKETKGKSLEIVNTPES
ncbi:MFS transporter [Sulfobacillus thermosulfidooxidans]|uniref:MFS transporter n=1 Tax=Sulfobacillus thermosulfidooxidans TaxID=28034 RepID=UPI00096B958A|nr:MFS transporter [Sulfobacillus thermosulfidooxidans]OLZ10866.1 MFS transporter [Sulfobacillus thermosulfidooxidans]OLZ14354.1 MFS transporter [Sulfobacillus thermosulfidooxidans]OLZ19097.1 MFS transporter [Sulfobacillus thermosulfidooxidans]